MDLPRTLENADSLWTQTQRSLGQTKRNETFMHHNRSLSCWSEGMERDSQLWVSKMRIGKSDDNEHLKGDSEQRVLAQSSHLINRCLN